jgi:hypothetical protein
MNGLTRPVAWAALLIIGLATVYTVALLLGMPDPGWAYLPRGIIHLGELAAIVALALCGAAGTGLLAKLGLGVAGLGELMLAVAEVITESAPGASDTLFAIAPNLVGLGLILTGVAVVRAGRWVGWRRYVTLALGIYVFAVLTPVIIAAGGPPAVPAVGALAVWEVLWALIAVAVLSETAADVRHGTVSATGSA